MEKDLITGKHVIKDAQKVQYKISRRLNELKKRKSKSSDIKYLWVWTHKLYDIAKERDYYAQKLHYAKRAFIIAFTDPTADKKEKRKG